MNRINLIGNLGKDAVLRTGPNGDFTTFSVAVNESWKDRNTGDKRTRTTWFNCIANGKLAPTASQLVKGTKVELLGSVRQRDYINDGIEVRTFDIQVSNLRKLNAEDEGGAEEAPAEEACILCKHIHTGRCREAAPNAQFTCACPGPCLHGKHPVWCEICNPVLAENWEGCRPL